MRTRASQLRASRVEAALKAAPLGPGWDPLCRSMRRSRSRAICCRTASSIWRIMIICNSCLRPARPAPRSSLAFSSGFSSRCRQAWRGARTNAFGASRAGGAGSEAALIDLLLARAATITIALLLAHSFVDYPLRTNALMGLFAFCCALLVAPRDCHGTPEHVRKDELAPRLRSRDDLEDGAEVSSPLQ